MKRFITVTIIVFSGIVVVCILAWCFLIGVFSSKKLANQLASDRKFIFRATSHGIAIGCITYSACRKDFELLPSSHLAGKILFNSTFDTDYFDGNGSVFKNNGNGIFTERISLAMAQMGGEFWELDIFNNHWDGGPNPIPNISRIKALPGERFELMKAYRCLLSWDFK